MASKFNFTIFGGLDKQFYKRFRALREKYKLDDRGMIECLVWLALEMDDHTHPDNYPINAAYEGPSLKEIAQRYGLTAPVDITLPEVI